MTYVPPERNGGGENGADQLGQTQKLPGALPSVGNGVDAQAPPSPYEPEQPPTVPFAADRGEFEVGLESGEPGPPRDRLVFQLIWEAILVLLTLNALFLVYQQRDEIFGAGATMDTVNSELMFLAPLLLIVTALGLSLRLGAVNLAVPAFASLVLAVPSVFVGSNPWIGLAVTAAAAAVTAVVFTVLVFALRVPAWMAGLAVAFAILGSAPLLQRLALELNVESVSGWSAPDGWWLFLGAAAVSVAGGLLGLIPSVRDRLTLVKGAVDGTERREAASGFTLLGGTVLSLFLAGAAGFLTGVFQASGTGFPTMVGTYTSAGGGTVVLTPIALIAVLLGGTSLWGRRGGIAGSALATVLVWAVVMIWNNLEAPASDLDLFVRWSGALFAGLLLVGLVLSFGLDRLGRPKEAPPADRPPADAALPEPSPFDPANQGGMFEQSPETLTQR